MAQMLNERGTSTSPAGVITVADLLIRYAPEPMIDPEPATAPVSVDSLLRREGREPHAADRPVQARAARQPDVYDDEDAAGPPTRRGPALRRSAIAAGVLLAAGSVFGSTAIMSTSSPAGEVPRPAGGYPGQGLLDPQQQEPVGAIPTVVDNTAQSDALDPGTGAPTSWMSTAFPGGSGGGPDATPSGPTGSAIPPVGGTEAPQGDTTPLGAADPEDDPAADQGDVGQGSGSDRPEQRRDGSGQGDPGGDQQQESGDDGVGGAVEDLGGTLPDPLGSPVRSLGRAVAGLL